MLADAGNVLGRGALLALDYVELHLLAFGKRLEAAALDRGVVNEAILLPVRRGDEAEALVIVEPLNCSVGTHTLLPVCY